MDTGRRPPNCRKPALERLARHSLFDRYMKAQLRLAGGRRKPGRHGFSSDWPATSHVTPSRAAAREVATGRPPPTRTTPLRPLALSFPSPLISSHTPGEFGPTVYLRDLRDLHG